MSEAYVINRKFYRVEFDVETKYGKTRALMTDIYTVVLHTPRLDNNEFDERYILRVNGILCKIAHAEFSYANNGWESKYVHIDRLANLFEPITDKGRSSIIQECKQFIVKFFAENSEIFNILDRLVTESALNQIESKIRSLEIELAKLNAQADSLVNTLDEMEPLPY